MSTGFNSTSTKLDLQDTFDSESYRPNMAGGFLKLINAARDQQAGETFGLPDRLDSMSLDAVPDSTPVLRYLMSGGASKHSNINFSQCAGCGLVGGNCGCDGADGGSDNEDAYKAKYLKYKAKYLKMKQSM